MQLKIYTHDLPLRHTFTISRNSIDTQPTLIVQLTDGRHSGYGEASVIEYYHVTLEGMTTKLASLREKLENYHLETPEKMWADFAPLIGDEPFAQCALDCAAHDLYARKMGKPLYKLWGLSLRNAPLSDYTIGIDTIEKMIAKLREVPFPIYKIKLGTDHDIDIVRALRKETDAIFRIDANCAWSPEQTIKNSHELKKLGVELIEQPLEGYDFEGMKEVMKHSVLPIIADESCLIEEDVVRCDGYFHGINIKLMKCGGLTPARRMIAEARKRGLLLMAGCMTESSIGISALAQLLPLLDYADMDGILLIKDDIAEGVKLHYGKMTFPKRNGIGVKML
jgi:L-Ala-D/L-Glu epimerase